MTYDATVVRVFLASPSDVSEERAIAREVIHEWNSVHSEERKVVLLPVGWETDASPEMGDRAQEIINRQLLSSCDYVIAIFWARLGTPTGASPSGTVEELRDHIRAGKPASIYFSNAALPPDRIDTDQYRAVLSFRDECRSNGLLEVVQNSAEFRTKLSRQLAQTMVRHFLPRLAANATMSPSEVGDHPKPSISADAAELLRAAVAEPGGGSVILATDAMGTSVIAGTRDFTEPRSRRSEARWIKALEELELAGFLRDQYGTRFHFDVTHDGFEFVDYLGG